MQIIVSSKTLLKVWYNIEIIGENKTIDPEYYLWKLWAIPTSSFTNKFYLKNFSLTNNIFWLNVKN